MRGGKKRKPLQAIKTQFWPASPFFFKSAWWLAVCLVWITTSVLLILFYIPGSAGALWVWSEHWPLCVATALHSFCQHDHSASPVVRTHTHTNSLTWPNLKMQYLFQDNEWVQIFKGENFMSIFIHLLPPGYAKNSKIHFFMHISKCNNNPQSLTLSR